MIGPVLKEYDSSNFYVIKRNKVKHLQSFIFHDLPNFLLIFLIPIGILLLVKTVGSILCLRTLLVIV